MGRKGPLKTLVLLFCEGPAPFAGSLIVPAATLWAVAYGNNPAEIGLGQEQQNFFSKALSLSYLLAPTFHSHAEAKIVQGSWKQSHCSLAILCPCKDDKLLKVWRVSRENCDENMSKYAVWFSNSNASILQILLKCSKLNLYNHSQNPGE